MKVGIMYGMSHVLPPKIHVNRYAGASQSDQRTHAAGIKPSKRRSSKWIKNIFWLLTLAAVFFMAVVGIRLYTIKNQIFVKDSVATASQHLADDKDFLAGESLEPVNILLLGMGGAGHDGPYLTDTIILVQIRPDLQAVSLTSIPRDTWVESNHSKINAVFAESFSKTRDYSKAGFAIRETVGKLAGLDIPYFLTVDFEGFMKAVDLVGGLPVNVERTFTDYSYPDNNEGYLPAQTFKAGEQNMNGSKALIYARSRHAAGPEGSDFARAKRQQIVIEAFKTKIKELGLVKDSGTILKLANTFADHVHTNLSPEQAFKLYSFGGDLQKSRMISRNFDPSTGLLCDSKQETTGAYILDLCYGQTAEKVQKFFKNVFADNALRLEGSKVLIADTTKKKTLSTLAHTMLDEQGVSANDFLSLSTTPTENIVFVVKKGKLPATEDYLTKKFKATLTDVPPPGFESIDLPGDFLLILSQSFPIPEVPKPIVQPKPVTVIEPFNSDQGPTPDTLKDTTNLLKQPTDTEVTPPLPKQ